MNHKVAFSFADGKTLFFDAGANEILLDAALRNGVKIPFDCREGVCSTCKGRCESGEYEQDYVDDEALSAEDLAQRKMLSCQTRVRSDASFFFDFDSTLCRSEDTARMTATVTRMEKVSGSTAILHLDASGVRRRLDFLPGQYARLLVPETDAWRSYSFANQPGYDNQLQFLIRLLPDGIMSNYLRERCTPGQSIDFEAPFGTFYLRHVERPLLMVAGGTGLSAFLGMLGEMASHGGCGQPVTLYYGVNDVGDLCEYERLKGYVDRIEGFSCVPVVVNSSPDWSGKTGYIPDHFDVKALAARPFDMYVCGPPPMVEAIRKWLATSGLQDFQLHFEKFASTGGLE
ncbi:anthranilate 1,2-dioxygenase electron transfer component AntC [Paraburkholderia sp. BR10954]|uniref:anthranilate 1,2-dioxygenase electron transfer component AntC n=1 Tax=Paraburkholderia sp. BR10954 TaxID=3236995 RepID=UPI0034D2A914